MTAARSERYKFRSFEEARRFARNLGLSGRTEWQRYCASLERPVDIPTNPNIAYRSQWTGWGDWLGTGDKINSFLPFEEARRIAQGLGFDSQAQYRNLEELLGAITSCGFAIVGQPTYRDRFIYLDAIKS